MQYSLLIVSLKNNFEKYKHPLKYFFICPMAIKHKQTAKETSAQYVLQKVQPALLGLIVNLPMSTIEPM
ncbi:MAG: hypothetical protein NVSMB46_09710 [Candidatus Saccharimonadales bacterium]